MQTYMNSLISHPLVDKTKTNLWLIDSPKTRWDYCICPVSIWLAVFHDRQLDEIFTEDMQYQLYHNGFTVQRFPKDPHILGCHQKTLDNDSTIMN